MAGSPRPRDEGYLQPALVVIEIGRTATQLSDFITTTSGFSVHKTGDRAV
jgi:hypothetical protein